MNGREVPIEEANYLFRAVALPPGAHLVEFRFAPTTVYVGALVSVAAWMAMAMLATSGLRERR